MPRDDTPPQPDGTAAAPSGEPDRESLVRALRDLEAAQARVQQGAERVHDETRRELIHDLLPVLDNLDRALNAAQPAGAEALIKGLRMVRAQLEGVLIRYGVERVEAGGRRFDPTIHEAVVAVPVVDSGQVGVVTSQIVPGYRFAGKLLRAAKVTVGVPAPPARPTRG